MPVTVDAVWLNADLQPGVGVGVGELVSLLTCEQAEQLAERLTTTAQASRDFAALLHSQGETRRLALSPVAGRA